MIKCLYIAGTLFVASPDDARPIGPQTSIWDKGEEIAIDSPGGLRYLTIRKQDREQTIEEFLIMCEDQATEHAEARYGE